MKCPKCGFENSEANTFCLQCGTKQETTNSSEQQIPMGNQPQAEAPKHSEEKTNVSAMKCDQCGSSSIKRSSKVIGSGEDAETVPIAKCGSCGAKFDKNSPIYYMFYQDKFKPKGMDSPLEVGLKGKIGEREYEILGRIRYQEEDEYEVSTWDEWYMISDQGERSWLVAEEGEFFLYKKYRPKQELFFENGSIKFDGKTIPESSGYFQRIVHIEGKLPWDAGIGEQAWAYDFKHEGKKFCIEKTEEEIEVNSTEKIKPLDLFTGFNLQKYLDLYHKTVAIRKVYAKKSLIYMIATLLFLVFGFYSCSQGKKVKNVMSNPQRISHKKIKYGPFELKKTGSIHRIKLKSSRLRNEWLYSTVALLNYKRKEIYGMTGSFWHESGYDSDGYWSESDLTADSTFVLEKEGSYYITVETEHSRGGYETYRNVRVSMIEGEKSYWYLLISGFIFLILWLLSKSRANNASAFPFKVKF